MNVYDAVRLRRTIRKYKDEPVPYEALERCVDAGRLAPTGRNRQLLEYVIVDDAELVTRAFDCITVWPRSRKQQPGAFIIILVDRVREQALAGVTTITNHDVGFAAENIILVALEQGLGSCPVASFDDDALRRLINVPASHDMALLLAMGYPAESPVAEDATDSVQFRADKGVWHVPKRRLAEITHHNRFAR